MTMFLGVRGDDQAGHVDLVRLKPPRQTILIQVAIGDPIITHQWVSDHQDLPAVRRVCQRLCRNENSLDEPLHHMAWLACDVILVASKKMHRLVFRISEF